MTPVGWLECVTAGMQPARSHSVFIGVLPGEGIGPEVTEGAIEVLRAVSRVTGLSLQVATGGLIGLDALRESGSLLPDEVVNFCAKVFAEGGCILNGPGGGRYVYDLRRQLDLFFKISPIQAHCGLPEISPLKREFLEAVDLLIVRENSEGLYQGQWEQGSDASGSPLAQHAFSYGEPAVRRFLDAAARLAQSRRGELTVVYKKHGVPSISDLWQDCAQRAAAAHGIQCSLVDVDLMAYQLVQCAHRFDVIAAPNMFGDILADLAAVHLGSRAHSFSGNFSPEGRAVYQTNHGAAYDVAGTDTGNPVGQMLSLAMMLRVSFWCEREAWAIEEGIRRVWRAGWRTRDVAHAGAKVAGTREMSALVAEAAVGCLEMPEAQ